MPISSGTLVELIMVVAFIVGGTLYIRQRARLPVTYHENSVDMRRTINDLTATVNTLRRQLDEADRRIRALEAENVRLETRVGELETQLGQPVTTPMPTKPLLVISGTSATFERDRAALRRANVPFHRLTQATQNSIRAEMRRRRQDGTLYPWVLISAHAGPDGILLADGIAPPAFWHEVLEGIQVVVLACCAASTTADELAGLVDCVIWFTEGVGNEDAADWSYAFWRRLYGEGQVRMTPLLAYTAALRDVPQVAEFVDLRHG